jgi:UDP-N-acetylglucosamine--N-acetylmuramyl-(pentapeptide) pyrophosphoryl-undecaprenol N-acetylglucosamine transferase
VLSLGGYAAGPGGLAAWWLRRPLVVHEQNSIPGMTNRVLAKLAQRIYTGFPTAFAGRGQWVGNPVRSSIAALAPPAERMAGRSGPLKLLVIGGSQGAAALNRLLPQALLQMPEDERPQVWHQCGQRLIDDALLGYRKAGIEARVVPFIDDMAAAYAWADLCLCRAGALTLAELTAAGLGATAGALPARGGRPPDRQRALADRALARPSLMPESNLTQLPLHGAPAGACPTTARVCCSRWPRRRARRRGWMPPKFVASGCLEVAR